MQTLDDIRATVELGSQDAMAEMLEDLVKTFIARDGSRRRALWRRYTQDDVPIQHRQPVNLHKVVERLANDFYGDIVDTKTGYMGNEVTITLEQTAYATDAAYDADARVLDNFLYINGSEDDNNELVKMASACGVAYRLLYVPAGDPSNNEVQMMRLNPWEVRLFYDTDTYTATYGMVVREMTVVSGGTEHLITEVDWYDSTGIEFWRDNGDYKFVPAYDRGEVEVGDDGEPRSTNRRTHTFDVVPIIEFPNNEEMLAEPEKSIPLMDAYDVVTSATTEEVEQFRLAYLMLKGAGMQIDQEVYRQFEQTGIIPVDTDGDAKFVVKEVNKDVVEWLLCELRKNIYKFGKSIDLSKDYGGDLRVIGWQVALLSLENSCKVTERKFKRALSRQYKIVTDKWRSWGRGNIDPRNLRFTFTRNMPQDVAGEIDMAVQGSGTFSLKTLFSQVSFIDDPEQEIEQIQEEQERYGSRMMDAFNGEDNTEPEDTTE